MRTNARKPRYRRPIPGDIYQIADTDRRFYYAAICIDGNCAFFDYWSPVPLTLAEIEKRQVVFMRLAVSDRSIADNWTALNDPTTFRHPSVGSTIVEVIDPRLPNRPAETKEDFELPKAAVWLAENVLPVLRYRFFRSPELNERIKSLIGKPL